MKSAPSRPFVPTPPDVRLTSLGGLRAAGVAAGIKPSGRPDVALLVADEPIACAAVFTRNAFAAAPVIVSREHLRASRGSMRALVVNAGNANACTGERGLADARATCDEVARLVGCAAHEVLVASTGIIGVPLPLEALLSGVGRAHASLARGDEASAAFLAAIQTTDAFPKEIGVREAGIATAGVAKGAGMIEPDMATMLAFVGTGAALSASELAAAAPAIAERSFNAIHVDSHASTNDMLLLFSTKKDRGDDGPGAIEGLGRVCEKLAWLIARDGEGATKVVTIDVVGAPDQPAATDIARRVAHSALVRTALFGNDPNWGRFVSAAGNSRVAGDLSRLECRLQGLLVFADGAPVPFDRAEAARVMDRDDVRLVLDLHAGSAVSRVMTSDLGYRYVEINAEYTT